MTSPPAAREMGSRCVREQDMKLQTRVNGLFARWVTGLVVTFAVLSSAHADPPPASQPTTVHIVIAGDATSADNTGWGGAFAKLICGDAGCANQSRLGQSSGAFLSAGCWKRCLSLHPDYVLIQFGHNDELGHAGSGPVDPNTVYKDNLRHYVDDARAAGVKPILITPMARRQFGPDGKIHSSLQPYAEVVRDVANEKHVPLVDLHARSIELYEKLGPDGCRDLSYKKRDGTFDVAHLSAEGAKAIAPLVVDELKKAAPELATYLK